MNQLPLFKPKSEWTSPTELPDLRRHKLIGIDTETKDEGLANDIGPGWPFGMGYIDGFSIATVDGFRAYYPVHAPDMFSRDQLTRWLADHFKSEATFVFFNAPYDLGWFTADMELDYPAHFEDAMLAVYHLDENRLQYSLDSCCKTYGIQGKDTSLLREAAATYGIVLDNRGRPKKKFSDREMMANMWKLPTEYKAPYAEQDAASTLELWQATRPLLGDQHYAYTVDRDILPMTVDMRRRGIAINYDAATQAQQELQGRSQEIMATLGQQLGLRRPISIEEIRSGHKLAAYFDSQKVPYPSTAGGEPSFTAEWMTDHDHWLPSSVAAIRQSHDAAEKFLGNYILGYSNNGRIHAEILSYRDDTGGTRSHRFSYRNPPLQQMPARVAFIKKLIRGVFEPDPGSDWLAADYSQQEPRLTVHYAAQTRCLGWEDAIEYYTHGDGDYHTMVATMTGLPRGQAKIINLGLAYGMGKYLLAASLGVSLEEAEAMLKQYHGSVPFIQLLTEKCTRQAARKGQIKLIDGAVSHFDMWELSKWGSERKMLPREAALKAWPGQGIKRAQTHKAMNRLIQGGAARQTKKAMLDAYRAGYLPYLQMHDELDFPVHSAKDVRNIGEIMVNAIPLRVPVKVDLEVGKTWGEATTDYREFYRV
jgi:DNA polymerase I-like protein with 3'-5' exonuclease and polymerase domains